MISDFKLNGVIYVLELRHASPPFRLAGVDLTAINTLSGTTSGRPAWAERMLPPLVNLGGEHQPARPSWECQTCGDRWPCPAGRTELHAQYAGDRVGLAMHMGVVLHLAVTEIPYLDDRLFDRFLAWTR